MIDTADVVLAALGPQGSSARDVLEVIRYPGPGGQNVALRQAGASFPIIGCTVGSVDGVASMANIGGEAIAVVACAEGAKVISATMSSGGYLTGIGNTTSCPEPFPLVPPTRVSAIACIPAGCAAAVEYQYDPWYEASLISVGPGRCSAASGGSIPCNMALPAINEPNIALSSNGASMALTGRSGGNGAATLEQFQFSTLPAPSTCKIISPTPVVGAPIANSVSPSGGVTEIAKVSGQMQCRYTQPGSVHASGFFPLNPVVPNASYASITQDQNGGINVLYADAEGNISVAHAHENCTVLSQAYVTGRADVAKAYFMAGIKDSAPTSATSSEATSAYTDVTTSTPEPTAQHTGRSADNTAEASNIYTDPIDSTEASRANASTDVTESPTRDLATTDIRSASSADVTTSTPEPTAQHTGRSADNTAEASNIYTDPIDSTEASRANASTDVTESPTRDLATTDIRSASSADVTTSTPEPTAQHTGRSADNTAEASNIYTDPIDSTEASRANASTDVTESPTRDLATTDIRSASSADVTTSAPEPTAQQTGRSADSPSPQLMRESSTKMQPSREIASTPAIATTAALGSTAIIASSAIVALFFLAAICFAGFLLYRTRHRNRVSPAGAQDAKRAPDVFAASAAECKKQEQSVVVLPKIDTRAVANDTTALTKRSDSSVDAATTDGATYPAAVSAPRRKHRVSKSARQAVGPSNEALRHVAHSIAGSASRDTISRRLDEGRPKTAPASHKICADVLSGNETFHDYESAPGNQCSVDLSRHDREYMCYNGDSPIYRSSGLCGSAPSRVVKEAFVVEDIAHSIV